MNCINPILVKVPGTFNHILAPCGQCWLCRTSRRQDWSTRIGHEYETSGQKGAFVTLTYDDEHCPPELVKKDLQDFFKRIRITLARKFGCYDKFKYYACGEYGDRFGRPHYHFIAVGVPLSLFQVATPLAWTQGFVKVAGVTSKSIGYVCGYTSKKMANWRDSSIYKDRQAPFQLQSQGIGLQWAKNHKYQLRDDLSIRVAERELSIPRYYLKKLFPREMLKLDKLKAPRTYDEQCQIDEIKDFYERLEYKQDEKEFARFCDVSRETNLQKNIDNYCTYQLKLQRGDRRFLNESPFFNEQLAGCLAKHEGCLSQARLKSNRIDENCSLQIKNYFKRAFYWKVLDKYARVLYNEVIEKHKMRCAYAKTRKTQRT